MEDDAEFEDGDGGELRGVGFGVEGAVGGAVGVRGGVVWEWGVRWNWLQVGRAGKKAYLCWWRGGRASARGGRRPGRGGRRRRMAVCRWSWASLEEGSR